MDRKIHFNTIKKYYKEKFDVDVDLKSFDNQKSRETYDVIFNTGIDIAFVTKVNDGHFLCMDSDGNKIDGEYIYGVVNTPFNMKENKSLEFSEHYLNLHYEYEIIDNEELLKREVELYPERTSIMLRGMFARNGFSSEVTNFYVDEIIYVDEEEFTKIGRTENVDTFKKYNEKTYESVSEGVHGVLVIGPNGDGIMVDTQGYDYARYMSYSKSKSLTEKRVILMRWMASHI